MISGLYEGFICIDAVVVDMIFYGKLRLGSGINVQKWFFTAMKARFLLAMAIGACLRLQGVVNDQR